MKNIMKLLLLGSVLFTACKSNNTENAATKVEEQVEEIKSTTAEQGKAGRGKITIVCNAKTYEINGVCGAVTTMGSLTIAIPDDSNNAKTFTLGFATDKLSEVSGSYTIVKSRNDAKDANLITVEFTDITDGSMFGWDSDDNSGKLDFTVNGNEINCKFSDIKLQPYAMYNKGEQNAPATASGEFTIVDN